MAYNQFDLLRQRRFLPFFVVQSLGAFNDNVYRQAIIGLLFWLGVDDQQRTLYTNLAPALFILPFFLFSATAGRIADRFEKRFGHAVIVCGRLRKSKNPPERSGGFLEFAN